MQEGILLLVVTIAIAWLCVWSIVDRSKPSKYWWPFDMKVHEDEEQEAQTEAPVDPHNWRNRRQGMKPEHSKRAWRRSGS